MKTGYGCVSSSYDLCVQWSWLMCPVAMVVCPVAMAYVYSGCMVVCKVAMVVCPVAMVGVSSGYGLCI